MSFIPVLEKMLQLTAIMVVGYIAGKAGVMTRDMNRVLSTLVLKITLPALILSSVMTAESLPGPGQILSLFVLVGISYAVYIAIAIAAVRIFHFPGGCRGAGMFALIFGNVAYMGYPITQAIWGSSILFYTMVFNLPFNLLGDTLGLRLVLSDKQYLPGADASDEHVPERRSLKQVFCTPIVITSAIAIFLAFTRIPTPAILGNAFETIGGVTTPVTMMIIGSSLSAIPIREVFTDKNAYILVAVKLFVMPLVIWMLFRWRVTDPLALGAAVILAAMPAAALGQMLCVQYRGNESFMAKVIFISTVCSVITIPLMAMLVI